MDSQKRTFGKIWRESRETTVVAPKCESCIFEKQYRSPRKGSTTCKDKKREGILKTDKLKPGDLVFTDQYETSVEGRIFSQRGHNLHQFKCLGGTLFYDAASGKIFT